jgi:hypothetical protein
MKIVAAGFVLTAICVIAALSLLIVEGLIAHALRKMHSALMRDSRALQ